MKKLLQIRVEFCTSRQKSRIDRQSRTRVTTRIVLRSKKLWSFGSQPRRPRVDRSEMRLSLIANCLQSALTPTSTATLSIESLESSLTFFSRPTDRRKGRWTCSLGEVSFAHEAAALRGAAGVAHVTFFTIPFHSPNPVPSSVKMGAHMHRCPCPAVCHAFGRDGTRFTVRHRL